MQKSKRLTLALAIAATTLFSGACEMQAPVDETVSVNAEGRRWMPGHYLAFSPSRRHDESKRIQLADNFLRDNGSKPGVRGVVMYVDWDRLENGKGDYNTPTMRAIEKWLAEVEGTEQGIGLLIRTRSFGASDPNRAFVPQYIKDDYCVTTYGGYVALPCLWEKDTMDRKIALIAEVGRRFDSHPNFALVTSGETSLNGEGYSDSKWKTQLKRYLSEGKKSLKQTLLVNEMNFLGGGDDAMHDMAQTMSDIGGVSYGWPDTVPCRDSTRTEKCGYKISSYDVARSYRGELPITPNVETWDLLPSDLDAVFDMLTGPGENSFEANYVLWQSSFSSRRWADQNGGDETYNGWLADVLAKLKKENGKINKSLPSSMGSIVDTKPEEPEVDAGVPEPEPDSGPTEPEPDGGPDVGDGPDGGDTPGTGDGSEIDLCEFNDFFC